MINMPKRTLQNQQGWKDYALAIHHFVKTGDKSRLEEVFAANEGNVNVHWYGSDGRRKTPLVLAVDLGYGPAIDFLVRNGADMNDGIAFYILGRMFNNPEDRPFLKEVLNFFLDAGMDPNQVDEFGRSLLMALMRDPHSNSELIERVLATGHADPFYTNGNGVSALIGMWSNSNFGKDQRGLEMARRILLADLPRVVKHLYRGKRGEMSLSEVVHFLYEVLPPNQPELVAVLEPIIRENFPEMWILSLTVPALRQAIHHTVGDQVDLTDTEGNTLLHHLAQARRTDVQDAILPLITRIDVDIANNAGNTVMHTLVHSMLDEIEDEGGVFFIQNNRMMQHLVRTFEMLMRLNPALDVQNNAGETVIDLIARLPTHNMLANVKGAVSPSFGRKKKVVKKVVKKGKSVRKSVRKVVKKSARKSVKNSVRKSTRKGKKSKRISRK